ncbi:MAG: enoyl-CoA hydratase/isomerase family protein [Blastomonas sp.]
MDNQLHPDELDHFGIEALSPLGDRPVVVLDARKARLPQLEHQAILIGLDSEGTLPPVDPEAWDILLTSRTDAPAPWLTCADPTAEAARLARAIRANPVAASLLARTLRITEQLHFADALAVESMAYSTLLGSAEFARWRDAATARPAYHPPSDPVMLAREGNRLTITLSDPASRNGISATMRDALYEALANALDDPGAPDVMLMGAGKCFSTGGVLAEFGTASDMALAHATRLQRSCCRLLHELGTRATVHWHGACVGSGLEIPAAAGHRVATPDAWFQLPELAMGLIPGAGGCVSVTRAIGRHRTAWLAISGKRIAAEQALQWGLVQAIAPRP